MIGPLPSEYAGYYQIVESEVAHNTITPKQLTRQNFNRVCLLICDPVPTLWIGPSNVGSQNNCRFRLETADAQILLAWPRDGVLPCLEYWALAAGATGNTHVLEQIFLPPSVG